MMLAAALAGASAAISRLDQALSGHPLGEAFLHRVRLESVRQQAAVDGQLIDPWQLAVTIEGLRLRMDPYLRIADRGRIFEAAQGIRMWVEAGGARAPIRAAVIRFWRARQLLRAPVPLTGGAAFRTDESWEPQRWVPAFLRAIEREAADGLDRLHALERAWFEARRQVAGRRTDSHIVGAVDVLAAAPVLSATSLASVVAISAKSAIRLLDALQAAGVAIEVTHRSKRRLFGLKSLAPLREVVRPPYRPDPGRGRSRPPIPTAVDEIAGPPPVLPPLTPVERRAFDYGALEETMAHLDAVVRHARRTIGAVSQAGMQQRREPEFAMPIDPRDADVDGHGRGA